MNINIFKKKLYGRLIDKSISIIIVAMLIFSSLPIDALAIIYQPGETLNPACAPTDLNCAVAPLLTTSNTSNVSFGPTATTTGGTADLKFLELASNGSSYTGFKSPDSLAANVLYTLPNADGANGQVLSSDGAGTLSWTTSASSQWTTAGNNIYYNAGNIGIGTSAPTANLSFGATTATINNAATNGALTISSNGTGNITLVPGASGIVLIGNNTNQSVFIGGGSFQINTSPQIISLGQILPGAPIIREGLRFLEPSYINGVSTTGNNYVGFQSPGVDLATTTVWSLPVGDGTNGQMLATNGAGALSWATSSGASSLAAPIGSNANGGSIASNVLTLSLADGTNPGIVSTSTQTFAGDKTLANNLAVNGNTTLGDASTDRVTVNGQLLGANALVFQGATDNTFETTLAVTDPTADRTITIPDASGALLLDSTGFVKNGNSFAGLATLGTNDNNGLAFETNSAERLRIDAIGNVGIGTSNPSAGLEITPASSMAIQWTLRSGSDFGNKSVAYGNGIFVSVTDTNVVFTSTDGITWTQRSIPTASIWRGVTYANGLFVVVGSVSGTGTVMTSPDGITWTNRTPSANNSWQSIAYGSNIFVAVASSGTGNRVMTSPDGITWTSRTSASDDMWYGVTYGNNLFVAVSYLGSTYRVMTSPDGIAWTGRDASISPWNSVAYGGGLFVAVSEGGAGSVITSPDGITWTDRTPAANNNWKSVTYGNGLFVAVSYSGIGNRVMTSPDGITWTSRTSAADNNWQGVTFGNNLFVAVANSGITRVMTSSGALPMAIIANGSVTVGGNIAPTSDAAYDLGSATKRFRSLYLSGTTLYIGDQSLSNSSGVLTWSGASIQATSSATSSTEMRFSELSGNGANYTGFKSPDALAANILYTLPSADAATGGQVLSSNGAGVLSWATPAAGGVASLAAPTGSNANGGSISGSVLALSLADGTNPGLVSTGAQTIAGAKTFSTAPTLSAMTAGSLLFAGAGGLASQDNASLFWDDTNNRLGIGTSAPSAALDVAATAKAVSFNASSSTAPFQINGSTVLSIGNGTTFVGNEAGKNNQATAYSATFVGHYAGRNNTTGTLNTAVGGGAFSVNTIGSSNTAIGALSLTANTTGYSNAALGAQTLMSNTIGTNNTAIGTGVLAFNIEGVGNTAVGSGSALLATGNNNTASGVNTGVNLTTGNNNSLYGYQAGDNITSGSNNLIIGYNIDAPLATGNNQLSIGNLIFGTGIDGTGTTVSTGNIGIGTSNPISKLHIVPSTAAALQIDPYGAGAGNTGDLRLQELAANGANYTGFKSPDSLAANVLYTLPAADAIASGQVLSSNATGALSWITPASGSSAGGTGAIQFASGTSFAADAANLFWDDTNNRLGIGTATPATKLAVAGGDVSVMSAPPSFSATGGTITTSGGYTIHTFTSSGIFTVTGSGTVDVLAVAGGAGGGGGTSNAGGAGGGAGGVVYATSQTVATGSITVTVGTGGAGGGANTNGSNGGNSSFGAIMATGGGGGGSNNNNGSNGGSGGGGGFSKTGGTGMAGQGNNGGNGGSSTFGAGGGAGGVGGNGGGNGGNGGPGVSNSISGTATTYAGGGAGSYYDFPPSCTGPYNGAGGSGGGGNVCVNGTNGLGGGGGGAGVANSAGPNGGSGIIIARYLTPSNTGGNVGIGTIIPSQLLEVVRSTDGIVARFTDANGSCDVNPTSTALICSSDERLKKNIITIDSTLEKMLALNPITFNWNKEGDETEKHLGFIAQDVEKLFPSLVSTNEDGFKAIAYGNFTPLIVKALQEQQFEIAGLTGSNALAFADANNIGADENRITDPAAYITDKINMGIKIAKELVAERIVAVQGYFKRIFANELCLTDSSGAPVCVTGDNLKNIGGTAENFQFPISNFQSSFNGSNPNIEVPIASPPVETPAPELSPIVLNEVVSAETPISSADGGSIPNQSAGADATGQAGQASIAPLSTVESSESTLPEPAVHPSGTAITAAAPAEAESAAVENAANNSAQRQSGQIN